MDVYTGISFGIAVSFLFEQSTVAPLHVHGEGQEPGKTHSPARFVSSSSSPVNHILGNGKSKKKNKLPELMMLLLHYVSQ